MRKKSLQMRHDVHVTHILVGHLPVGSLSIWNDLPHDDTVTPHIAGWGELPVGYGLWSRPPDGDLPSLQMVHNTVNTLLARWICHPELGCLINTFVARHYNKQRAENKDQLLRLWLQNSRLKLHTNLKQHSSQIRSQLQFSLTSVFILALSITITSSFHTAPAFVVHAQIKRIP